MDPALSPIPPSSQKDQSGAILKLLSDDDQGVVSMVMEQLVSDPSQSQSRLEALLEKSSGSARRVILSELERISLGDPVAALRERCRQIKTVDDYEDFCWKMALCADPRAKMYESKLLLNSWAKRVKAELVEGAGYHEQLAALRLVLAQEEGLRGNEENYYDPDNSFLDKVISTRMGLPISLTAIYMLVGHRAGIIVEPVGMPGHFLARVGACYFTPFTGAAEIERSKLEETLSQSGYNSDYDILDKTPLPLMAQRMANNLVSIYSQADDLDNLRRWQNVLTWLQEVPI